VGPDSFGKLGVFRFNLGYFTMKHLFLICLMVAAFDSHADDVSFGSRKSGNGVRHLPWPARDCHAPECTEFGRAAGTLRE
jgi:hypothetical protein